MRRLATAIHRRHALCLCLTQGEPAMTQKTHLWLRILGVVIILALEFGPRVLSSSPVPRARLAAATTNLR